MSALGDVVQLKSIAIEERLMERLHWSAFSSQKMCVWQLTRFGGRKWWSEVNRISHPDWVKLSVELNCAPNQNTKFSPSLQLHQILKKLCLGLIHPDNSFQSTVTDIFHMVGHKYVIYANRYSDWTEVAYTKMQKLLEYVTFYVDTSLATVFQRKFLVTEVLHSTLMNWRHSKKHGISATEYRQHITHRVTAELKLLLKTWSASSQRTSPSAVHLI